VDAGLALEQHGFTQVSNVLEGFEGALDGDHHRGTPGGRRPFRARQRAASLLVFRFLVHFVCKARNSSFAPFLLYAIVPRPIYS